MGRQLGSPTVTNFWIPDGSKDTPIDRLAPQAQLEESLDAIFAEAIAPELSLDAVEAKLFGIGSECYVVGSHEFYLGYAITRGKLLCLDAGHFSSHGKSRGQDFQRDGLRARGIAAREPRRALG